MASFKQITEKVALFAPLLIGFVWFSSLVISGKQQVTEAQLAPGRLNILVTSLFAFIIIYSGFLLFLYFKYFRTASPASKRHSRA